MTLSFAAANHRSVTVAADGTVARHRSWYQSITRGPTHDFRDDHPTVAAFDAAHPGGLWIEQVIRDGRVVFAAPTGRDRDGARTVGWHGRRNGGWAPPPTTDADPPPRPCGGTHRR